MKIAAGIKCLFCNRDMSVGMLLTEKLPDEAPLTEVMHAKTRFAETIGWTTTLILAGETEIFGFCCDLCYKRMTNMQTVKQANNIKI